MLNKSTAIVCLLLLCFGTAYGTSAYAKTGKTDYDRFSPAEQTLKTKIEYDYWDKALSGIVLSLGKSIRRPSMRPTAELGSRKVTGHTSRYRLEGSRVIFSVLEPSHIDDFTSYKKYLVSVANGYDLQNFSEDEQLAFWFNLHNLLLIETIAKNYPIERPSDIRLGINEALLHEAKLVEIKGIPLSLRNIREDIVYKNWSNPNVVYGFYLGEIGGPAIMNYAFSGENVQSTLKELASEFVTSLRGFEKRNGSRMVSKLYEDVRPFYFSNWPNDLEVHLKSHADDQMRDEIFHDKPFRVSKYAFAISDIVGGKPPRENITQATGNLGWTSSENGGVGTGRAKRSVEFNRFMQEYDEKVRIMKRRKMITTDGQVIISDIEVDKGSPRDTVK